MGLESIIGKLAIGLGIWFLITALRTILRFKMSTKPPNVNFGSPTIFFDSHPEEQESYLHSWYTAVKGQLVTAWSGVVPKPVLPGKLKLVWWTVGKPPRSLRPPPRALSIPTYPY
jgi:hypothetical protein